MRSIARVGTCVVAGLLPAVALAQSNLGSLLDAGATRVSPASFREEVVQRVLVGPAANGASQELIYTQGGVVQGVGSTPASAGAAPSNRHELVGEWVIDDLGRVCGTIRRNAGAGGGIAGSAAVVLPFRCQFWFKLGDTYFVADSEVDRQVKVLSRTIAK